MRRIQTTFGAVLINEPFWFTDDHGTECRYIKIDPKVPRLNTMTNAYDPLDEQTPFWFEDTDRVVVQRRITSR